MSINVLLHIHRATINRCRVILTISQSTAVKSYFHPLYVPISIHAKQIFLLGYILVVIRRRTNSRLTIFSDSNHVEVMCAVSHKNAV